MEITVPWDRKPGMRSEERKVKFGPIEFKDFRLSHRNPVLLIALSFVPGGTTESRPALQCRVSAPPLRRVPEGRLKRLACAPPETGVSLLELPFHTRGGIVCRPSSVPPGREAFPHQPGTEVPGYFQPSLPGRRAANGADVLYGMSVNGNWGTRQRSCPHNFIPSALLTVDISRGKAGDEVQLRRQGTFPSATWEREIRNGGSPMFIPAQSTTRAVIPYHLNVCLFPLVPPSPVAASTDPRRAIGARGFHPRRCLRKN